MTSIRFRLILLFLLLAGGSNFLLVRHWTESIRPAHLRSMEESLVDTATLLAAAVSEQSQGGIPNTDELDAILTHAHKRTFEAKIYELTKTNLDLRVYVTDAQGTVIYDTASPSHIGYDYRAWNDVLRTLRGEYGARSTRANPDDPSSSTMYVSSPIMSDGIVIGVLGVGKHVNSLSLFIETSRRNILKSAAIVTLGVALLIGIIVLSITHPIRRLTAYANAVGRGERPNVPKVSGGEMSTLAAAFEDMRDELEGKKYVEQYVENLTHEMKSPLTAIRANTELLHENDLPAEQRARFLANVETEADRLQTLVDRMLQLAELESRKQLESQTSVDLCQLLTETKDSQDPAAAPRKITLKMQHKQLAIQGDRLLLQQALINLIQNAIDFTSADGTIHISLMRESGYAHLSVTDDGPGLPDYAIERATERFFSTPRPNTGRKSSGLGLAFVAEIATLHNGTFSIKNKPNGDSGTIASIKLPLH